MIPSTLRVSYQPRKGRATDEPDYLKAALSTNNVRSFRRAVIADDRRHAKIRALVRVAADALVIAGVIDIPASWWSDGE